MDQINPFTNAPMNQPEKPAAAQQGQPQQQAKQPSPAQPPAKKAPFDPKPLIKGLVFAVIGVIAAKIAFDNFMPAFTGQQKQPVCAIKKPAAAKKPSPASSSKKKISGGQKQPEKSLSEQFNEAKKIARPAPAAAQSQDSFTLNGIFLSEGDNKSSAIVNDKVVMEGDTVSGAMVTKISIDGIELEKDGRTIKIRN